MSVESLPIDNEIYQYGSSTIDTLHFPLAVRATLGNHLSNLCPNIPMQTHQYVIMAKFIKPFERFTSLGTHEAMAFSITQ